LVGRAGVDPTGTQGQWTSAHHEKKNATISRTEREFSGDGEQVLTEEKKNKKKEGREGRRERK